MHKLLIALDDALSAPSAPSAPSASTFVIKSMTKHPATCPKCSQTKDIADFILLGRYNLVCASCQIAYNIEDCACYASVSDYGRVGEIRKFRPNPPYHLHLELIEQYKRSKVLCISNDADDE